MNDTPTLGLCMIGKDEATILPGFLERIPWNQIDQFVWTDTGSTDASISLVSDRGAEVYPYKTTRADGRMDNFAAARNLALSKMRTDWILIMDADEWIEPEGWPRLKESLCAAVDAFTMVVATQKPSGAPHCFESYRLFRNTPEIYYSRRLHATVDQSVHAWSQSRTALLPVRINHKRKPMTDAQLRQKKTWYAELAMQQLKDTPNDPYCYNQLGRYYQYLGDMDTACTYYHAALQYAPGWSPPSLALGCYYLKQAYVIFGQCLPTMPEGTPTRRTVEDIWRALHTFMEAKPK